MSLVRGLEHGATRREPLHGQAIVDVVGGKPPQSAVVVLVVVPADEISRAIACMLRAAEALGEIGTDLSVLNCASLNGLSFD